MADETINRSKLMQVAEILGFEPNAVTEAHIYSSYVEVSVLNPAALSDPDAIHFTENHTIRVVPDESEAPSG